MNVRVLLVDDEKDFVETLAERLQSRCFQVSRAFSGEGCLDVVRKGHVDVVILDVLMPGKDGLQTLREIKQIDPLVEVMMLTGHGTVDTAIEGLKMGAYDYLRKPTDTADLMAKILRAYARKSEQEERIRRAEIDKAAGTRGW